MLLTDTIDTDTVDYVATDQNGLTSTSTRTIIVEAPSIIPTNDASNTTPAVTEASTGSGKPNLSVRS